MKITTLEQEDFPKNVINEWKKRKNFHTLNKKNLNVWNFLVGVRMFHKVKNKFPQPFKNDLQEKSNYSGRDAISFSGGKDSVVSAILSKETQGESPLLLVNKLNDKIKKIAELLESDIAVLPRCSRNIHSTFHILMPYYLDHFGIDFSGRLLVGTEVNHNSHFYLAFTWDESMRLMSKNLRLNYDTNVDIIPLVSSTTQLGHYNICKKHPEIAKLLVFESIRKRRRLDIFSTSVGLKCNDQYLDHNSVEIREIYNESLNVSKNKSYNSDLEQAIYKLTNGEMGKQHDCVYKINQVDRWGIKSRKIVDKLLNEEYGFEYNDNIPDILKTQLIEFY